MKLSVIIPCKNEEQNVIDIHESIAKVLKDISYELIFIDDGSTDATLKNLKYLYSKDKLHVKVISLSRNFKKEAAMYAGLSKATGAYTCIVDADLQQNPKYILEMYKYLEKNQEYDQVAMVMDRKKIDNKIKRLFKKLFYKIITKLSDVEFVDGASDFRMFKNNVKEAIISLTESNRFSKGIFSWIGFNTKYLPYKVEKRKKGETKFTYKESFKYAFEGIVSFSTKPLRIAMVIGVICSLLAFIYFIITIIQTFIFGIDVPGYASLLCMILFLGGTQLITIGILGEYLGKTYIESKRRPIYISREEIGFDK